MNKVISTPWRALVAACLLVAGSAAMAAPVPASSTITPAGGGFNGTRWYLSNQAGTCAGGGGFGFDDAEVTGYGDAYDQAWSFLVDGLWVDAPGNTVDLTGSIVTTTPVMRSGLNVNVQHYYSASSSLARIMLTMQNPGSTARTVNVQVPINFGSDGSTVYRMTSSGDSVVTTADRWVVASDGGPYDPVNTSVMYGPGSPRVVPNAYTTAVFDCAGTQGLGASYTVTVPAGATRSLLFFAGLAGVTAADNSVSSAINAANRFNSPSTFAPDWLSGLTTQQQRDIVNWNLDVFESCAAEGFTGSKLTLCRQICEVPQAPTFLSTLIKIYRSAYREDPPCA